MSLYYFEIEHDKEKRDQYHNIFRAFHRGVSISNIEKTVCISDLNIRKIAQDFKCVEGITPKD